MLNYIKQSWKIGHQNRLDYLNSEHRGVTHFLKNVGIHSLFK